MSGLPGRASGGDHDSSGPGTAHSSRGGSTLTLGAGSSVAGLTRSGSSTAISSTNASSYTAPTSASNPKSPGLQSKHSHSHPSPKGRMHKVRQSNSHHGVQRPIVSAMPSASQYDSRQGDPDEGGSAGFLSSTANLLNTAVGTGCLALPIAVSSVGLIPGLIVIVFSGLLSGLGLWYLAATATCAPKRSASFSTVSAVTFSSAGALFDLAVAIKCFGVSVSYLIIIGDLMPQIVLTFRDDLTAFSIQKSTDTMSFIGQDPWMDRRLWIGLSAFFLVPLASLRRLDSLKYTSFVALLAVVYLVFIVVLYFIFALMGKFNGGVSQDYHLFGGGAGVLSHLPIFIFSMTCHQNIYSICNEIRDNRPRSLTRVIIASIGSASIIYIVIATAGYITFGTKVGSNIIAMYPNHSIAVALGRIAIVVLVLFSYPLQTHPCRSSLDKVLSYLSTWNESNQYTAVSPGESSDLEDTQSLGRSESALTADSTYTPAARESSLLKCALMTVAILIGTYTLAMIVQQLDTVLSFVGSTGSTAISFILPGLLYVRMNREAPWTLRKIFAALLAVYGCFVMFSCLTINIISITEQKMTTFSDLGQAIKGLTSNSTLADPMTSEIVGTSYTVNVSMPTGTVLPSKEVGKMPIFDLGRLGDNTTKGLSRNETLGSGRIPGVVVSPVHAPSVEEAASDLHDID